MKTIYFRLLGRNWAAFIESGWFNNSFYVLPCISVHHSYRDLNYADITTVNLLTVSFTIKFIRFVVAFTFKGKKLL